MKRDKIQVITAKKVKVVVVWKNLQAPGIKQLRPPGAWLTTTRKTPQGSPEIYSDTQFPSLQSAVKHVESRSKDKEMEKSFEVVRHKNRGRNEFSKNQAL
uniref:Uncharacterized protein n=1 Tax=Aotus nancymaae TaxID=37293 RepID=A0A2K5EYX4_AOTNA